VHHRAYSSLAESTTTGGFRTSITECITECITEPTRASPSKQRLTVAPARATLSQYEPHRTNRDFNLLQHEHHRANASLTEPTNTGTRTSTTEPKRASPSQERLTFAQARPTLSQLEPHRINRDLSWHHHEYHRANTSLTEPTTQAPERASPSAPRSQHEPHQANND